jgi:branched-chain amino acid transport system ATP-binding protein
MSMSAAHSPLLEAENVSIAYGDATAVWDVSLTVGEREIVAVIGPNGAGKSTLINAIAGLLRWRQGRLRLGGVDLGKLAPYDVCRQGIALVPEGRRLFVGMSVEENLEIGSYRLTSRAERRDALERTYKLFPVLFEKRTHPAGSLSGGQQQMIAIGRALMARPRLLLLDEPSLGLAPAIVTQMFDIIRTVHAEGVAILLVEQNVTMALNVASNAYVLEQGRIVHHGRPAELLASSHIRDAYLGV